MISKEDSHFTYEYLNYYKILPKISEKKIKAKIIKNGKKVTEDFYYDSKNNTEWMTKKDLLNWIHKNYNQY